MILKNISDTKTCDMEAPCVVPKVSMPWRMSQYLAC